LPGEHVQETAGAETEMADLQEAAAVDPQGGDEIEAAHGQPSS